MYFKLHTFKKILVPFSNQGQKYCFLQMFTLWLLPSINCMQCLMQYRCAIFVIMIFLWYLTKLLQRSVIHSSTSVCTTSVNLVEWNVLFKFAKIRGKKRNWNELMRLKLWLKSPDMFVVCFVHVEKLHEAKNII